MWVVKGMNWGKKGDRAFGQTKFCSRRMDMTERPLLQEHVHRPFAVIERRRCIQHYEHMSARCPSHSSEIRQVGSSSLVSLTSSSG